MPNVYGFQLVSSFAYPSSGEFDNGAEWSQGTPTIISVHNEFADLILVRIELS